MDDAFTHTINRDEFERYMVFISNGNLRVVDLLNGGQEVPVSFPDGKEYLQTVDNGLPRESFSMVTVADYTFVVNKNIVVELTPDVTPEPTNEALVYVRDGYVQTTYTVTLDGVESTHTTEAASVAQPNTLTIAQELAASIQEQGGFTADVTGSTIRVRREDGEDFTFQVNDSWGEQALVGIKRQVAKFTDLPAKAFDGFKVKVTGESKAKDDDYYVEYNSEGGTRNGTWDEVRGWGMQSDFDIGTMPHVLIRQEDGSFIFKRADGSEPYPVANWESAHVGDDESCPPPTFIGQTIRNIFFYQNRLGILAGENVVLSRDSEFFDFWPKTATTLVATDPIDVASSDEKVSVLNYAVAFHDALSLFSPQVQFQLGNGGAAALSPETIRIDPSTRYDCSPLCSPLALGQNLYFTVEAKDNTSVMEYFVTTDAVTLDAVDVTAHCSRYIPHGVFKMVGSTNDNYLLLLSSTTGERNKAWLYKFFWIDEDKVQSAWGTWIFSQKDILLSVAGVGSDVYLVFQRPTGITLEHMNLQSTLADPGLGFQVHLDRRVEIVGTYDVATNLTSWVLPYSVLKDDEPSIRVVLGGAFIPQKGKPLKPTVVNSNVLQVEGRFDQGLCYIGFLYESRIRLSEQFMRESKDVGAPVIQEGRLQLLRFSLLHRESGFFHSEVRAKGREVAIKKHLGTIGDGDFKIGSPVLDSLPHTFSVLGKSNQVTIDVVSEQHYPMNLLSAEWIGLYTMDSRRV
jgi:hypothetical protein